MKNRIIKFKDLIDGEFILDPETVSEEEKILVFFKCHRIVNGEAKYGGVSIDSSNTFFRFFEPDTKVIKVFGLRAMYLDTKKYPGMKL